MTRKESPSGATGQHPDPGVLRQRLREWYGYQPGQWLIDFEREQLEDVLSQLFGYYLVQAGAVMDAELLSASRIRNRIILDECWPHDPLDNDNGRVRGMYGRPGELPLQNDSVDVVVLPHTLEFEPEPHQVLRETERVLVSEGHVVILGFNPWSLWGGRRLVGKLRRQSVPWHGTFRSAMRIRDWLALLGFEIVTTRYCFFRPPMQHQAIMSRLAWLERLGGRWWPYLGGVYIIVARKEVVAMTPIRPRWRPRRSLIQPDLPKPTT